ncbi:MAG: DUF393 domain-containing protein [Cryobacterium sp.]|uniref:thiol-disulfide oxidoreductase DCC family protein n=1 Tax=unclassified Cryobacterium TaxID=2649013 RepID=UPI0018C91194|nr:MULTISPECIES: DCC1-like thiol-disulfide oxidoreductase family protein [unclassified Cryobacterium]MCY7405298.1 DUF393 domain-containing protein [Cryobacterium sp.]
MAFEPVTVRPILIFDGDCGFCTTGVAWLGQALAVMPMATPSQGADLASLGLTGADGFARGWLVVAGRPFGRAATVAALLRQQPRAVLGLLGWPGTVSPLSWAAEGCDRLVGRYRFELLGGTPVCRAGFLGTAGFTS